MSDLCVVCDRQVTTRQHANMYIVNFIANVCSTKSHGRTREMMMMTMTMMVSQTHPSVRIKSTENNYNPVQCFDVTCPDKTPHMHCPFCVKTESYTDPVILKAHYRVKHVDKGIEYAGLKVLRCCDQCDIVGVIKGEKKFKGAHWHCYKCKNGFNRRDEAIKHYKTHFRNPQTTFQIQIAQEVNQPVTQGYENDEAAASLHTEEFAIHPVLTEAISCASTVEEQASFSHSTSIPVLQRGLEGQGVAAVETVSMADNQTIMIIQDGGNISSLHDPSQDSPQDTSTDCDTSIYKITQPQSPPTCTEAHMSDLPEKVQSLVKEKAQMQEEIDEFKKKVAEQSNQIEAYKLREQALLDQLSVPIDKTIQSVCDQLQIQHRELLQQQLLLLKRTYIQSQAEKLQVITSSAGLTNSLGQTLDLQTLDTVTGATVLSTMSFASSSAEAEHESQTDLGQTESGDVSTEIITIPIPMVNSEGDAAKCTVVSSSPTQNEQFEILETAFPGSSLGEERLQIKDDDIPIENCGGTPPSKKRKLNKTS